MKPEATGRLRHIQNSTAEPGFPAAVSDGRYVYVSQLLPRQADGTVPVGIRRQVQQALQNLFEVLCAAGAAPETLLQLTLTVADDRAVSAAKKAYSQWMPTPGPALCWRLGRLPGALVAVDAVAAVTSQQPAPADPPPAGSARV